MIEIEVEIKNHAGMHTSPAATIVKLASKFESDFYILKDGLRINGKSIIGVMTLAAEKAQRFCFLLTDLMKKKQKM